MLPKVATQILHHTSRAVVVAQNQTSHTIRNVLQLQSSSGASTSSGALPSRNGPSSSSHWGGDNGTRPGGQNFSAGSRFHNGFIGESRAVTISIQHDESFVEVDDSEEPKPKVLASRTYLSRRRSHSLSIGTQLRHRRDDRLPILETIQRHARSRHAFAQPRPEDHSSLFNSTTGNDIPVSSLNPPGYPPFAQQSFDANQAPDLSSPSPFSYHDLAGTAIPSGKVVEATSEARENHSSTFQALKAARDSDDQGRVKAEVLRLRDSDLTPSILEFNMAIEALCKTRRPGDSLAPVLETYNDMLKLSLRPSVKACLNLIQVLSDRDFEVHKTLERLDVRLKRRRIIADRTNIAAYNFEEEQMTQLRKENNHSLAVSLFDTIVDLKASWKVPGPIYLRLLRSCSNHCNADAAIRIFAHLEKRSDILPPAAAFGHLIDLYGKAGDIQGANEVFNEFRMASTSGRVSWLSADEPSGDSETQRHFRALFSQLLIWNKMVEAYFRCGQPTGALSLLEQMMDTTADENYGSADIPPPASSTFTTIIQGFCRSGDVQTALVWFDRLLQQGRTGHHPLASSIAPVRPDQHAWIVMLETLALRGMTNELNRLFLHLLENAARDRLDVRAADRILIFRANMKDLQSTSDSKSAINILDFVLETLVLSDLRNSISLRPSRLQNMMQVLISQYLKFESRDKAFTALERFVDARLEASRVAEVDSHDSATTTEDDIDNIRAIITTFSTQIFSEKGQLSFEEAIRLMRVADRVGLLPSCASAQQYLRAYATAAGDNLLLQLTLRDWELFVYATTSLELERDVASGLPGMTAYGTLSILQDLVAHGVDMTKMAQSIIHGMVKVLSSSQDKRQLSVALANLGTSNEQVLNNACLDLGLSLIPIESSGPFLAPNNAPIRIDSYQSHFVDEFFPCNPNVTPLVAYARYESGLQRNLFPDPATMGRLISSLGRLGEIDKVHKLYHDAQRVLASLENDKKWQSQAWFNIEDQMIVACAHAGELDSAHVHRERILAQGGAPTADSYGALIECVKDTTDDTSNALALFHEAQSRGVLPNIYLYNNVISKLAKARKADFALELFQQMKASQIQPTSITYGAVIAACARVGDSYSAELLFTEMTQQRNYKPRIPPFNTMMQLYAQTKPNRDRVLYYYNALLNANIRPTAHTYKLLIDAYGSIEPIDIDSMEHVFRRLEKDPHVHIQGSHWAAIINAWGCVKKDLDKAIEVFESIAAHPSTLKSPPILPDAVTFEALINVFVAHRRADLIPQYIERLETLGVHMTAYIANCLIKGYAAVDDLEQSRRIFESLRDPPEGIAASNNHVPHHPSSSTAVPAAAPIYREPSTWEAMVRAELGTGNRSRATELLDRMQARKFPAAVYNRIRGIMFNDSSPVTSPPAADFSPS